MSTGVPARMGALATGVAASSVDPDVARELAAQGRIWQQWSRQLIDGERLDHELGQVSLPVYVRQLTTTMASADAAWTAVAQACLVRLALVHNISRPSISAVPAALTIAANVPSGRESSLLTVLVPAHLRTSFAGAAGQHVTIAVDVAGVILRRSYSIVRAPAHLHQRGELTLGIRAQHEGAVSQRMVRAAPGDRVVVWPPTGRMIAPAAGSAPRTLLLAAGSGVTPLVAIAEDILNTGPSSTVTMLVVDRRASDVLAREILETMARQHPARFSLLVLTTADGGGRPDGTALADAAVEVAPLMWHGRPTHSFTCGPGGFTVAADECADRLGVPAQNRETESFVIVGGQESLPRPGGEVTVDWSGRHHQLKVAPGASLLAAATANQLDVPYSCLSGACGTCAIRVVRGAVAPRSPEILGSGRDAQGWVLACQAAPTLP